MLCSFLVAFAVVSFPTALLQAAGKPPGKCLGPVGITVERRNDLVTKINKRRTLMVKGLQRHGFRRSGALNVGENVLQMEWSCDLEREAFSILHYTCPKKSPRAPNGTTGFFNYMEKNEKGEFGMDPMLWWLGEIGRERLFSWYIEWNEPIRYWGHNRNWANLVRHDASRIGCAENYCDRHTKHAIFCLTDKPPLEPNDVVYPWGKGACPEGTCRPPYDGCNIETGLCIKPVPPTTTTTKKPPCQPRLGGLADLFSFNIC